MLVRFSSLDEFVEELKGDPHAVARNTVRVTSMTYPTYNGTLTRLSVVGTAKVISETVGGGGDYDLIELTIVVGDLWRIDDKDTEVIERGNAKVRELQERLEACGFRIRSGRYESLESIDRMRR